MPNFPQPEQWVRDRLLEGLVIPAHPLALTKQRKFDAQRQRALTRYYHAAGAGGIAVGVHTTQFAIRNPEYNLLEPVLKLAADTTGACDAATGKRTVRIAGICGHTDQALREARLARELGYHAGLLSLAAFPQSSEDQLINHSQAVASELPLFGFYLQPAVGGRVLSRSFWRRFAGIPNVLAIKIAPFNRYRTLDVLRGVLESDRFDQIALYTGNDDTILTDILTPYALDSRRPNSPNNNPLRIVGGLLGHWACWTRAAVQLLQACKNALQTGTVPLELLRLGAQITDCNAAFFDAAHDFRGCIPGIHEVLRRQGLMEDILCLDPGEHLSPGQLAEIDRVHHQYPHLDDTRFVQDHLRDWLAD